MPSQILPITRRPSYPSSASAAAMLIKPADDDDPSASFLVSSRFDENGVATIKPLLSRSSSCSSTFGNSMGNMQTFTRNDAVVPLVRTPCRLLPAAVVADLRWARKFAMLLWRLV